MRKPPDSPDPMHLLPPATLAALARLDFVARSAVEGFIAGRHKSPHKGFSVEFAEHRQYVHGDDPADVDWRAYAKSDRYYVKQFEDETNLRSTILLDCSGSMAYAGRQAVPADGEPMTKFEYGRRLAAALAYLLIGQQDAVGLVTFDTAVRSYIPAAARPGHIRVLLEALARAEPGRETALADVLHGIAERIHRRSVAIVISDLFDDTEAIVRALHHFAYRKHEVLVLHVMAQEEIQFPFDQWTDFLDAERPNRNLRLDPAAVRAEYLGRVTAFLRELREACGRMKVTYVPFSTSEPFEQTLARHLNARRRKQ